MNDIIKIEDIEKETPIEEQTKPTKDILCIDFNIIMYPCIKLYRDIALNENENATVLWNFIENYRGVTDKFLQIDTKTYTKIVKLIKLIIDNNPETELIDEGFQRHIPDYLMNDNYKYNIINIDFFHDIFTSDENRNEAKMYQVYDNSNWIGYLFAMNKVNHYSWIMAPNSELYNTNLNGDLDIKFDVCSISSINIIDDLLKGTNIEKIFITFPENYVPYQYKYLYDLIKELFISPKKGE